MSVAKIPDDFCGADDFYTFIYVLKLLLGDEKIIQFDFNNLDFNIMDYPTIAIPTTTKYFKSIFVKGVPHSLNWRVMRADSWLAASQWETSLHSNAVFHWLGAHLESAL